MFTRTLLAGADRFVHALVRLDIAPGAPSAMSSLDALAARPDWTLAKRVIRQADGRALVLCQVLAPAAAAAEVVACLLALDGGPWRAPTSDDEFDDWLIAAPASRALVVPAHYSAGDLWFACPLRAADLWPRLLAAGARAGQAVGYQTNLYACRPTLPVLRELALNHDRLHRRLGVPPRLQALQTLLVARARRSRWLMEEVLMLDSRALAAGLQRDVDVLFRGAYDDIGDGPQLRFSDSGLADNLALACDYDETWAAEPSILAAQATDLETAVASLDLQADLNALPLTIEGTPSGQDAVAASEPYVFISYAHVDTADMRRVRGWLHQAGVTTWVDEHLQGGEEWDATLEDRIRRCALLLVLMSPAAAQSRFVRRELRFADAMGRRLLCFRLREATLVEGMAMLLLPLQWIDDGQAAAEQQLVQAIRRWLDEHKAGQAG